MATVPVKEQWELLGAVYKHGTNIEALKKALPHWGHSKLQHCISSFRNKAKRKNSLVDGSEDEACMKSWLLHTENMQTLEGTHFPMLKKGRCVLSTYPKDHGLLLSKAMLYLSEKEEHPPPSTSTDPDYTEIYRYLAQTLAGEEPSEVSQGSAAKILQMLNKMTSVVKHSHHKGKLNNYLHLNPPEYLTPRGKKRRIQKSQNEEKEEPKNQSKDCPLFREIAAAEEESEEEEIKHLREDDPDYELKEQKARKKCKKNQLAMASSLTKVPGVNPYGFSVDLLMKPEYVNREALQNI